MAPFSHASAPPEEELEVELDVDDVEDELLDEGLGASQSG
jgi:hypothetical protein